MAIQEDRLSKLKKLYDEALACDKAIFSEQRTNILLKNGEHYRQRNKTGVGTAREAAKVTGETKIRLVKNHIHKVVNIYSNSILESNPSVKAMPFNESELHDVKTAELNNSILEWVKQTNDWDDLEDEFVDDFIVQGEVFGKVYFDYAKGEDLAFDEATGENVKAGEFVIERIMPYDMKRDADARSFREARYFIETKLMNVTDLIDLAAGLTSGEENESDDIVKKIQNIYNSPKLTVFDSSTGKYKETRGKVEVRLYYFRPTPKSPQGIFSVATDKIFVGQSPLPLGLFPIIYSGFDRLTNSPRHTSIIRVVKPFQVEYNRTNSKMAEHQITLGDDRVYIQKGTRLTGGKVKAGVRSFQVSGAPPVIQSGRSGAQYLDYAKDTKADLYDAANIDYAMLNKQPAGDPYQMLFAAMKDKKKFVKYVNKFGTFEVKLFKLILKMAKEYLDEGHMIKIAGKKEMVNIPEFKSMSDSGYEIKLQSSSGDVETQFGKVLSLSHVLQYAGSSLAPEQIGQVIRSMPYGNEDMALDTITLKSRNAENLILALDRGEYLPTMKYDDHEFLLSALYNRVKSSDFLSLDQGIQANYDRKITEQEEFLAKQKQEIAQSNMGMIPSGGFLTTVNTSWFNPERKRVERIKIPSAAIDWLMNKLQAQGAFSKEMEGLDPQAQAEIAQMGGAPQAQEGMPQAEPMAAMPQQAPQVQ